MVPILLATLALVIGGSLPTEAGQTLNESLENQAPELDPQVLELALEASACAEDQGVVDSPILTVIDYSLPSTEPRLWVLDLEQKRLLYRELVSHGMNTGENYARLFSNREGSRQSSLGLFLTNDTYYGRNGYSLRLHGLEQGINHLALERTIVMHGAWYVSETFAEENGRLGRSWGCPALERDVAPEVIDTIKDGSLLFVYYPDDNWLGSSEFLNGCRSKSLPSSEALAAR
jgi:hypothetical protein